MHKAQIISHRAAVWPVTPLSAFLFPKVALRPHPYWRAYCVVFLVFLLFTTPPVYQDCFSSICEHLHGAAAASGAVSGWAHECPRTSSEHIDYTDQKASNLSLFIIYWGEDQKEGNEAETLKTCVISRQSSEQAQDRKCRDEGWVECEREAAAFEDFFYLLKSDVAL